MSDTITLPADEFASLIGHLRGLPSERLVPLIAMALRSTSARTSLLDEIYHDGNTYELRGDIVIAYQRIWREDLDPAVAYWRQWMAYDAATGKVLSSPDLPDEARSLAADRFLVERQLQYQGIEGRIETVHGTFYCDDGMLVLEPRATLRAWDMEDLTIELSPHGMEENRKYYAEMVEQHHKDMVDEADNENERRIDAYYDGSRFENEDEALKPAELVATDDDVIKFGDPIIDEKDRH